MEKPQYLKQGNRLYKINNNIIVELDLSSYEHGVIGCNTADARTCIIQPNEKAKKIGPAQFEKFFKTYMAFLNKANKNTGGK